MNRPINLFNLLAAVVGVLLMLAAGTWISSIALESRSLRMVAFGVYIVALCISLLPLLGAVVVLSIERIRNRHRDKK